MSGRKWTGRKPIIYNAPQAFVGSGPYVCRDFDKTQGTYFYEAFPDYYRGKPKADRLIYIRSSKPMVSLLTGQAGLANIEADMAQILLEKGLVVIKDERGWNRKLMINHRKPPFDDKRVRQAIAHAIDRRELIEKGHRGFGSPASYGLLSMDHDMYNPDTPTYSFDPNRARRLLQSVGFQQGRDGFYEKDASPLKVELLSSAISAGGESTADRDGEIIKKHLERAGIEVDLVHQEQTTTDSRINNWDFDLAVLGYGGISGDPKILNKLISSRYGAGSVNSARFDGNEQLNSLLEEQMLEMDEVKRREIVYKIQEIYADELPAISLYYPDSMAAYDPRKGIIWFYTRRGLAKGIPIPQNKISLLR